MKTPGPISAKKYALTYRQNQLDPKVDGDSRCISSQEVEVLAEKNYSAAVNFLKKISPQDRATLLSGMQKRFFGGYSIPIDQEVAAQLSKPTTPFLFRVASFRNCERQPRQNLTDTTSKIHVERFCDSSVFPLQPSGELIDFFSGDREFALVLESFTGANCVSYTLKDLLPKLNFTESSTGKKIAGLTWQEIFIDPSDKETVQEIWKQYFQPLRFYTMKKNGEVEEFAYQVEQDILKNQKFKSGDILAITSIEGKQKKYIHLATLENGKYQRLALTGKLGSASPIVKTSIASQIVYYREGNRQLRIEVYRKKP